jgi:hypothetical protein
MFGFSKDWLEVDQTGTMDGSFSVQQSTYVTRQVNYNSRDWLLFWTALGRRSCKAAFKDIYASDILLPYMAFTIISWRWNSHVLLCPLRSHQI